MRRGAQASATRSTPSVRGRAAARKSGGAGAAAIAPHMAWGRMISKSLN